MPGVQSGHVSVLSIRSEMNNVDNVPQLETRGDMAVQIGR